MSAQGALYYSDSTPGTILDNNNIGLTRSTTISDPAWSITSVILSFTLQNGFGSDLQGYLRMGNLESSPAFSLNSYLSGLGTIPNSATPYTVDVTGSFLNLNPNSSWTLFFADTSPGGQTSFGGWTLDISAVPEPTNVALGVFAGVGGVVGLVRWRKNRKLAQA